MAGGSVTSLTLPSQSCSVMDPLCPQALSLPFSSCLVAAPSGGRSGQVSFSAASSRVQPRKALAGGWVGPTRRGHFPSVPSLVRAAAHHSSGSLRVPSSLPRSLASRTLGPLCPQLWTVAAACCVSPGASQSICPQFREVPSPRFLLLKP